LQRYVNRKPHLTVARREDILVFGVFADGQVIVLAKLLVAVQTGTVTLLGVAFANRVCRRRLGLAVEMDQDAFAEARAFA
jgi:hypothetical protein